MTFNLQRLSDIACMQIFMAYWYKEIALTDDGDDDNNIKIYMESTD